MNWVLFCQIEVIILTIGLVMIFVGGSIQNAKDNSFFARIASLGKALSEYSKERDANKNNEKVKMFEQLMEHIKEKQNGES